MNRLTNYLLICIALFFGLAILNDRLSKLHLFEGMTDDAEPKQPKKKATEKNEESFVASETPVITHPF